MARTSGRTVLLVFSAALGAAACDFYGDVIGGLRPDGSPGTGGFAGTGGSGGSGGTGGSGGSGGIGSDAGLPCEAANLLAAHCVRCHGNPLSGAAPMALMSLADLQRTSALYGPETDGQRSVARMQGAAPMPPAPAPLPAAADITAFAAWVNAGMPEGTCDTVVVPPDAGPAPLTCLSNKITWKPVAGDPKGGDDMAPGYACKACHLGQDFNGQNPGGAMSRTDTVNDVMGTVFNALHEKDLCATDGGTGVRVEIRDSAGAVKASFTVTASGNFRGNVTGGLPNPYTARVVRGAASIAMTGGQTSGDCNTCHTEQGLNGAPGRIVAP